MHSAREVTTSTFKKKGGLKFQGRLICERNLPDKETFVTGDFGRSDDEAVGVDVFRKNKYRRKRSAKPEF